MPCPTNVHLAFAPHDLNSRSSDTAMGLRTSGLLPSRRGEPAIGHTNQADYGTSTDHIEQSPISKPSMNTYANGTRIT